MPSSTRSSVESRNAPNGERLAGHARVAPVERVADRADDERDAARDPPALQDQHRGDDAEREAGERDRVRRQPRLDQTVAELRLVVAGPSRGGALREAWPWRQPIRRAPGREGLCSGAHAQASGPHAGEQRSARRPRRPRRRARPVTASKTQWLAVTTTTHGDDGGVDRPQRLRPAAAGHPDHRDRRASARSRRASTAPRRTGCRAR